MTTIFNKIGAMRLTPRRFFLDASKAFRDNFGFMALVAAILTAVCF